MKMITLLAIVPLALFGALKYDKATQTWKNVSDDPLLAINADINEKRLEKRLIALNKAKAKAFVQTNVINVLFYPGNPAPANVKVYSKMKCVLALTEMGVWPQVKAWIEDNGLYDVYLAAQDFRSDNPYFVRGLQTLQGQLGLTDAQIKSLLKSCEAE